MYSRGDRPRGRREREEGSDEAPLIERVVQIRRVAKVVKGGGHLSFTALVVVGDGQGSVGVHLGKSRAVPDAVRKGTLGARKNMHKVTLKGTTIPHEIVSDYNGATVLLRPASAGTGMIAGGGVRAALEAAGVRDVLSKTFGSSNTINIVKATVQALERLRDPQTEIPRRRGQPAPTGV
ncbi:MAG: 30S ribosomal protein S5 [Chloroflexi bacterium]|nr:30S ribosomal protein S5 [Chloroflexota bacterium]